VAVVPFINTMTPKGDTDPPFKGGGGYRPKPSTVPWPRDRRLATVEWSGLYPPKNNPY